MYQPLSHRSFARFNLATAAALTAALAGGQAMGAVLSDFDAGGTYYGGVEGFFSYGATEGGDPIPTVTNPAGGTGDWLRIRPVNQYYGQVVAQGWAIPDVPVSTIRTSSNFEMDLIVESGWLPAGINLSIQIQLLDASDAVLETVNIAYANPSVPKDTLVHVNEYFADQITSASDAAANYNLVINGAPGYDYGWDTASNPEAVEYPGVNYYIDNVAVTVIPEPASAGMILAGLGALAGRRRR